MSQGPPKLAALDGWILLNSEANAMPVRAQEVFDLFGEGGSLTGTQGTLPGCADWLTTRAEKNMLP